MKDVISGIEFRICGASLNAVPPDKKAAGLPQPAYNLNTLVAIMTPDEIKSDEKCRRVLQEIFRNATPMSCPAGPGDANDPCYATETRHETEARPGSASTATQTVGLLFANGSRLLVELDTSELNQLTNKTAENRLSPRLCQRPTFRIRPPKPQPPTDDHQRDRSQPAAQVVEYHNHRASLVAERATSRDLSPRTSVTGRRPFRKIKWLAVKHVIERGPNASLHYLMAFLYVMSMLIALVAPVGALMCLDAVFMFPEDALLLFSIPLVLLTMGLAWATLNKIDSVISATSKQDINTETSNLASRMLTCLIIPSSIIMQSVGREILRVKLGTPPLVTLKLDEHDVALLERALAGHGITLPKEGHSTELFALLEYLSAAGYASKVPAAEQRGLARYHLNEDTSGKLRELSFTMRTEVAAFINAARALRAAVRELDPDARERSLKAPTARRAGYRTLRWRIAVSLLPEMRPLAGCFAVPGCVLTAYTGASASGVVNGDIAAARRQIIGSAKILLEQNGRIRLTRRLRYELLACGIEPMPRIAANDHPPSGQGYAA